MLTKTCMLTKDKHVLSLQIQIGLRSTADAVVCSS